jgi:hypothetical protein
LPRFVPSRPARCAVVRRAFGVQCLPEAGLRGHCVHHLECLAMPFTKLADIKTVSKYKEILKAELGKLSKVRVGYHYFDKVKLEGGGKDGDPFVLVGTYAKTIVDELKAAGGQLKARGTIGEVQDKGLEYTVIQGTLKASALKSALAQVKSFVVAEAEPVIDTQGGQEGKTPKEATEERRQRLKAELDKLKALYGNKELAEKIPEALRAKIAAALKAGHAALSSVDEFAVREVLGDISLHLSLFAQVQRLKAKEDEATVEDAAQAAMAESRRVDSAESDRADFQSAFDAAEKVIVAAESDVKNALKSLGADNLKPGQHVRETPHLKKVQAALAKAQQEAVKLKQQLAAAKQVLAKNPDKFKELLTQWMKLSGQLEAVENSAKDLFARFGLTAATSTVGQIKDAPGLKAASDALDKKIGGVAGSKKQLGDMLTWHESEARRLRSVHAALGQQVQALTAKPLGEQRVKAYEAEVEALKKRFDVEPDAKELNRDDGLRKQAAAADDWLKARAAQVEQAQKASVAQKFKAHVAAPWGAADQDMKVSKASLDNLLSGDEVANAGQLQTLLKHLATAGTPAWDKQWLQKQQATVQKLTGKPVPFDDMVGWAHRAYLAKRDKIDGKAIDKAIAEVDQLILAELKTRMKTLLTEMTAAFSELNPAARKAVADALGQQINATQDLTAAAASLEDFRRSVAWDFEEKLAAQMKQAHNALELQRRPTRAQWMAHFGIEKNRYKTVKTTPVFEYDGASYGTHFTISYDSVTAAQPRAYQASSASLLNAAFVSGVPTVLQAHATIEFPNSDDNPHLYLSGNIHPKGLAGADVARANAVLTAVRTELLNWLKTEIEAFQQTIQ